jgi:hypothetical protein
MERFERLERYSFPVAVTSDGKKYFVGMTAGVTNGL